MNIPDRWWLISSAQKKAWGAFGSPEAAWAYLFGKSPSQSELKLHKSAGWRVECCKWPQGVDIVWCH